ncbi:uncharacterized protein C5orf34 homolog [Salarias fasciatus]|uniref:uncharacterized protein C5orf34 homolog n=1 Tax=Salarias fasciatus TaxID=181472 RepID=UPI001176E4AA|nr:uncharacterized protein C5orf34 homolog [Salarias fasciatus]
MEAKNAGATLMLMYEDESVDVRYADGAQLQLSPCGSEFVLVKAADPCAHPLQPAERVRQRTRFTISTYKELMISALAFRNKYASRPYLPEEIISADQKKPFFSIDSDVQWPEWSASVADLTPAGETRITSEEGRAELVLSPSGEEFSVKFLCLVSNAQKQPHRDPDSSGGGRLSRDTSSDQTKLESRSKRKDSTPSRSCSPLMICTEHSKPEQMYQSVTVIQHHSCSAVPPVWVYPLSLAHRHWKTHFSKLNCAETGKTSSSGQVDSGESLPNTPSEERRSQLPQALPLTCPSPHRHRWIVKNPLAREEPTDLPSELVKIMWCQGVTYRILSGAVSVIEISPGDGSVIRSNGVLDSYFTHHKPELHSKQVKELTYHVSSLPPEIPGQPYSVSSIVSRASRILVCYNQTLQLLKFTVTPSCLQEENHFLKPKLFENASPVNQDMIITQNPDWQSELVAAELEKIKRFNFLLENSRMLGTEKGRADLRDNSADVIHQPMNENCIAEALQRTSKAIQDIDAVISAAKMT